MGEKYHGGKSETERRGDMVVSMNRIADMSLEDNKHMKFNITVNLLNSPDVHAEFELLLETDLTDDTLSDFFKKVDKFVIAMRVVQDAPVDTEKKDILLKQSFELLKKLYQKYIDSSIF